MKTFLQFISEMAPREIDIKKEYFHGTSKEEYALSIIENGIVPPDLTLRKGNLRPVEGKVYITPKLTYAIIYCLGGDMSGHKISDRMIENDGRYGYLFVVDGKNIINSIEPDEDSVGELIYNEKYQWLNSLAQQYISPNNYRKLMDGEYEFFVRTGKILNKRMNDQQKMLIIDSGAHIAYDGSVFPDEVYKFDKTKSEQLMKTGANFFLLSERIK